MADEIEKKAEPVTISAPPGPQVTVDPQNPLPEPSFFWRRVITAVMCFGLLGLAWHNAIQLHDLGVSEDLLTLAKWCIALNGFVLLCYFVGPSAAELVSMIQSAKIIRSSISMAANAAERPENRAIQADSGGPTPQDSHFPADAPDAAPTGTPENDEIDAAPTGRS